jgi:hypothetical protein
VSRSMSTLAARILDGLATVALAPACPVYGRVLDSPTSGAVCPKCWRVVRPLTPPVCDACGDPLPSWRVAEVSSATCRRCTPMPRTVDRAHVAGPSAGSADASIGGRCPRRSRLCDTGPATPLAPPDQGFQSVCRTRTPSRHSSRPRLVAGASHDTAGRTDRGRAPHQRPRPFLAVAMAVTARRSSALARRPHRPAGG